MKVNDIVRIKNRHPQTADIDYRIVMIRDGKTALRPTYNKSNKLTYMTGDVVNKTEKDLLI